MMTAAIPPAPAGEASGQSRIPDRIRIGITVVVVLALVIRLAYLWSVPWHGPHLVVVDPDGYTESGLAVSKRHFAMAAIVRAVAVYQFVKPPLYTIVLGLMSRLPAPYPLDVAILHVLLGGAMVFAVFWLGYRAHSPRAGLIAAGFASVYWPFASGANVFVQEALYIPLLTIALALLAEAAARRARLAVWAAAGALFGLAALTRSMPVYYLPPALAIYAWRQQDRRRALREAGACFLGFAILVAPYSIAISRRAHQMVLIENMGAISFPMRYPGARDAVHHTAPPPGVAETAAMLARAFAAHPIRFTGERLGDAMMLARLRGGRTVQLLENVHTSTQARIYKVLIDGFDDGLFALVCVLAPLGWACARQRGAAALVGGWIVLNVALLAAFTFTGARYRTPCVPALMVLAAIVPAGGWKVSKAGLAAGAVVSAAAAYAIGGSIPSVVAGRAEYGVRTSGEDGTTRQVSGQGELGLNVAAAAGYVAVTVLMPADLPAADTPARLELRLGGVALETWTPAPGDRRQFRYVWTRPELAHVEVRATGPSGRPLPVVVEVPVGLPVHGG